MGHNATQPNPNQTLTKAFLVMHSQVVSSQNLFHKALEESSYVPNLACKQSEFYFFPTKLTISVSTPRNFGPTKPSL
jgi:hypothetical protein